MQQGHVPATEVNTLQRDLEQSSIFSQGNNNEAKHISHRRLWLLLLQAKDGHQAEVFF